MGEQVVGVFTREAAAVEAATLLRAAGYGPRDLDLVAREPSPGAGRGLLRLVRPDRLMERPEAMWPCALKWGLIGSLVAEAGVLAWVLVAFDDWGVQVLLAATLWKFGTLFGGLFGAIAGADLGLESRGVRRYERHLAAGCVALAARVKDRHRMLARGAFIESGAFDVRSVEGRFMAREKPRREGDRAPSPSPGAVPVGGPEGL